MTQQIESAGTPILSGRRTKPTAEGLTDREAVALWRKFIRGKPLLSDADMYELERFCSQGIGQSRRITLATAKFSGKYHHALANESREKAVLVAMAMLAAERYSAHLQEMVELSQTMALRLRMALFDCDDMDAVIEEARHG